MKPKEKELKKEIEVNEAETETLEDLENLEETETEKKIERLERQFVSVDITSLELEGKKIYKLGKLTDRLIYRVVLTTSNNERITYKPKSFTNEKEKTETGFSFVDTSAKKGISIKNLDVNFLTILQEISKKGKVKLETSVIPYKVSESLNDGQTKITIYKTLGYKDIKEMVIIPY